LTNSVIEFFDFFGKRLLNKVLLGSVNVMTIMLGDIIATGTPVGVGPLNDGDTVEISIEGIGTLKNYVTSINNRR
jgi:hypothetical protein